MKITKEQIKTIEKLMPQARKEPKISNYKFIEAIMYILENGCKWRALPEKYEKWHTIYMRFSRWCEKGIIQKIFLKLQEQGIINIKTKFWCIDSTSVKVHPDATGSRKAKGKQSIGRSKWG